MANRKGCHPAFCFCSCNQKLQIDIPQLRHTSRAREIFGVPVGGIAQLVERQLCKLEVRGSNPLASTLIFDCRLPISDLQNSARKRAGNQSPINNLKSKIRAAEPPERACCPVGLSMRLIS